MTKKKKLKKYKKKSKSPSYLFIDLGSILHHLCIIYGIIDVNYDFQELYRSISHKNDEVNEIKFISDLVEALELLICEAVKKYSLYEMIYFSRRIRPANVFKCEKNEIFLYRNIMALAFQKYCEKESLYYFYHDTFLPICLKDINIELFIKKSPPVSLSELPIEIQDKLKYVADLFKTCYMVEFYSFYYVHLIKQYRTICKGAKLVYEGKLILRSYSDKNLLQKLSLYDKRVKKDNILSHLGGYSNISLNKKQIEKDDYKFCILVFQENLEEVDYNSSGINKSNNTIFLSKETITNYFPTPINLINYYDYISNFKMEFLQYYSFSIEEFLVFLMIICQSNMVDISMDMNTRFHMYQRGYTIYKYQDLKDEFVQNYDEFIEKYNFELNQKKTEAFDKIFSYLSYSQEFNKEINLKTIGPYKIFLSLTNDTGIIDYTNWIRILEQIMIPVCKDSDDKGPIFEDIVIKKIEELFGSDWLWVTKREIKANGQVRQIDVSFIYENVLIVLECKATNMSRSSYVGDKKAIEFRQMKNMKAISQADTTLDFMVKNWSKLNIKTPDNIHGILSLIVTPGAEYIWELNDNLLINDSLPRILSYNELEELKNIDFKKDIANTKFYRKI